MMRLIWLAPAVGFVALLWLDGCQPVNEGAGGASITASCMMGAPTAGSPSGAGSAKGYESCVTIVTASSPTTSTPTTSVPVTVSIPATGSGALP